MISIRGTEVFQELNSVCYLESWRTNMPILRGLPRDSPLSMSVH